MISLRDFVAAVEFPITVDAGQNIASGWYIREKKTFNLDLNSRKVTTDNGVFIMSPDVHVEDDDIFVPMDELASWFGFKFTLRPSALEIALESPSPLPVQESMERHKFKERNNKIGPAVLPLHKDEPGRLGYPMVDVSSNASFKENGDAKERTYDASTGIRTSGDLAGGTLVTQSLFNKTDGLSNARVNYKQESLNRELLGPLKARKYEMGDVNPTNMALRTNSTSGLGARVTNADPLRNTFLASTDIRGTAFPGWDVELYRENQLVSFQTVQEDGTYNFENVDLFSDDNNFHVKLYGPQGEIREEDVVIPVDPDRLANQESAYDVTIAAQDTQTYRKIKSSDEDSGAPAITATYDTPLGEKSAINMGFESKSVDSTQKYVAHSGISSTLGGTLLNLDAAVDDKSESAAQIVARRRLNDHQLRFESKFATDGYEASDENKDPQVLTNRFQLTGPLPVNLAVNPRYNLGIGYIENASGLNSWTSQAGLSASAAGISMNQQFSYTKSSGDTQDQLDSLTTLSGYLGRNRMRFISDYQLQPERKLESLEANVNRRLGRDMEVELGINHELDPRLTEGRAQLNLRNGTVDVSPAIAYDSDHNLAATISTRFGLAKEPQSGRIRSFDRNISGNGSASVFVYLDKNGDGKYNDGDEPIPDVNVSAPQNGGRETTDEKGYAFFNRLISLKVTDLFIDPESLKDPYWIPSGKGVSIIPHEGHLISLAFPVVVSGEVDGTVYLKDEENNVLPRKGITLSLTDLNGKKFQTVVSESDGYYLFQKIPPGKYYLSVEGRSFESKMARPLPQEIAIGYDGTTIYGKNIYLEKGSPDVPVNFVQTPDSLALTADQLRGKNIVVTMGVFKSRLLMAVSWFKARMTLGNLLNDFALIEEPSESYPDLKTGLYALRMVAQSNDFKTVYGQCKLISSLGQSCSIDIIPAEYTTQKIVNAD